MFEKYGEMSSAEEINKKAEHFKSTGDKEGLIGFTIENGLDKEDAEDFMSGELSELTTQLLAAFGKLKVETEDLKPYEIMNDWIEYIRIRCQESEGMAAAVRRKGKSLKGCIAALLKWSFENAKEVDKDVMKAAGIKMRCTLGIPGMATAKQIITDYYMKEE